MNKTVHKFDWQNGYTISKRLSRSFATLEDAKRFADGKPQVDIYRSKGRYKVEWVKTKSGN